jgi:hypothetical protein
LWVLAAFQLLMCAPLHATLLRDAPPAPAPVGAIPGAKRPSPTAYLRSAPFLLIAVFVVCMMGVTAALPPHMKPADPHLDPARARRADGGCGSSVGSVGLRRVVHGLGNGMMTIAFSRCCARSASALAMRSMWMVACISRGSEQSGFLRRRKVCPSWSRSHYFPASAKLPSCQAAKLPSCRAKPVSLHAFMSEALCA